MTSLTFMLNPDATTTKGAYLDLPHGD